MHPYTRTPAVSFTLLGTSMCTPLNLGDVTYFYSFWIPFMISESVLCALAIVRAIAQWRRRTTLLASGRALVAVLIRDSILYFVMYAPVFRCCPRC